MTNPSWSSGAFKTPLLWLAAGLLSALLTLLVCLPAAWLVPLVERQSGGRVTLGEVQGSMWRGSAVIAGATEVAASATALLPGRFSWELSPLLLLGQVQLRLINPAALSQPLRLSGNWWQWRVSDAALRLPAERLALLGAPLNTLQPSGALVLNWSGLQLQQQSGSLQLSGLMRLELQDMSSRLSALKPLGSYQMTIDWQPQQAALSLRTSSGALLLDGHGSWRHGHLQFSGTAQAAQGKELQLESLLNLLGQRRQQQDGKTIIGLEIT